MEKGFIENGFIINLSASKNTNQLVYELSNILEHPDVKGKRVCLKLGMIDLKQSQLLSIKALIEASEAEIAYIETPSAQTEATAISLGIEVYSGNKNSSDENNNYKEELETEVIPQKDETQDESDITELDTKEKFETANTKTENEYKDEIVEVESGIDSDNIQQGPINTLKGIEDVYTESSAEELSQIIPSETLNNDFETLAASEGLINNENLSKYILLDTGDVLPENVTENELDTKELPTLYLNQTLRSGQTVTYEGNILIIGDAHPGSEIIAEGDITVWGILGGIAHAGFKGNVLSKVRALKLNAIQLRIAGLYARRNDTLNIPYVQKTNNFTPEEAQIENGKIVIYKKLRRD
ncbi:septum site-determining protein MinC [bacterium]|nr:septum site-determining protein MinC [bacterium]